MSGVDEALRAVQQNPSASELHYNLGNALADRGDLSEAISSYRRALELRPDYSKALNNLGSALSDLGQFEAAESALRRTVELNPQYAFAHVNLGHSLLMQGRPQEAISSFARAVEIEGELALAHRNLGIAHLTIGDYERGWPEYEWRLPAKQRARLWDGKPLDGPLLLHGEQGIGDTLQFVRYAELARSHAPSIILRCHRKLHSLLQSVRGFDTLLADEDAIPPHAAESTLMCLPRYFGVASRASYIAAEPSRVEVWQKRLPPGFNVGIAWQGDPQMKHDKYRSILLEAFCKLNIEGVNLIRLQQVHGLKQIEFSGVRLHQLAPSIDEQGAFIDTAAIIASLDLVVTPDTAIAHLAGAMGKPVWLALSAVPDWRWGLTGETTPWYPTVRLFRQQQLGDWKGVFDRMASELRTTFA
jgi:hypothetical protein